MSLSRAHLYKAFSLVLIASFWLPYQANTQGKGMATVGKMVGGALIAVGAFNLVKDVGTCSSSGTNCAKIALDALEIAGGAFAMMNNGETESQLDTPNITTGGPTTGSPTTGSPGNDDDDDNPVFDVCQSMPNYCKINPDNNRPDLTLPPKDTVKDIFKKNWGSVVSPDGKTLDEALSELDANYDKATEAVAAFNAASAAGAFDTGAGSGELAGVDDGSGESHTGMELNRGLASVAGPNGSEMLSIPGVGTLDMDSFLNKLKKDRNPPVATKAVGLNLENRDGRVLSLFERVSRAVRGTRDRDILLAKVEWSRKEAAKKLANNAAPIKAKKAPHIAVSTDKN